MTDWPSPLNGDHPLVRWLNKLLQACKSRSLQPGVGYKIEQTTSGPVLKIRTGAGGAATPGGGMNWRGEYTQATSYSLYDVVKITTGTAAGVYIAVVSNPTDDPDTGIGWVQMSPGNTVGDWG